MRLRAMTSACVLVAAAMTAGCAGTTSGKDVRVVELGEVPQGSYDLVERIWVGTWYTPFYVPWYSSEQGAMEALKSQASMRGADAVANAVCIPDRSWWGGQSFFCHGDAVKMRPAEDRPFFTVPKT